jgi:hypothetical protein
VINLLLNFLPKKHPVDYLETGSFVVKFKNDLDDYAYKRILFQLENEFNASWRGESSSVPGYGPHQREIYFYYKARDLEQKFKVIKKWFKPYRKDVGPYVVERFSGIIR